MRESITHLDAAVKADETATRLAANFTAKKNEQPDFLMNPEAYELAFAVGAAKEKRDAELWLGAQEEGSAQLPEKLLAYEAMEPKARDYLAAQANVLITLQVEGRLTPEQRQELYATLWRVGELDTAERLK